MNTPFLPSGNVVAGYLPAPRPILEGAPVRVHQKHLRPGMRVSRQRWDKSKGSPRPYNVYGVIRSLVFVNGLSPILQSRGLNIMMYGYVGVVEFDNGDVEEVSYSFAPDMVTVHPGGVLPDVYVDGYYRVVRAA